MEQRAEQFAIDPLYGFDMLVLPDSSREQLLTASATISVAPQVFDVWNLRSVEPSPSSAVNFHGEPGTGKTLAAYALASHLGQQLLPAKASQLESKFHGDGAKNLDALFAAARRDNAILFVDEADSLLSRRFVSPSQGSEHAVNAMRSELLLLLDACEGLVIFATNFVEAYDRAFDTRVTHIRFPRPDEAARREIWRRHLPEQLPLAADVSIEMLGAIPDLTGRDIKRTVITAAVAVARSGRPEVSHEDLKNAVALIAPSGSGSVQAARIATSDAVPARIEHRQDGKTAS